ncbi:hypothetical protein KSP40_PGU014298 [Platanthera guangdongensis]|uniref:Prolamin-like domain-containing protein n=1 Tax=Platanthera guangdongensis TaxID=2320717 RepID=A0ABR2LZX5_9ASPA
MYINLPQQFKDPNNSNGKTGRNSLRHPPPPHCRRHDDAASGVIRSLSWHIPMLESGRRGRELRGEASSFLNLHIGLSQDCCKAIIHIEESCILAVFPSPVFGAAMSNITSSLCGVLAHPSSQPIAP